MGILCRVARWKLWSLCPLFRLASLQPATYTLGSHPPDFAHKVVTIPRQVCGVQGDEVIGGFAPFSLPPSQQEMLQVGEIAHQNDLLVFGVELGTTDQEKPWPKAMGGYWCRKDPLRCWERGFSP